MSDKLSDYDATSSLFCVHDVNKTIVTINRDGTLTYGPDYNPDEAAKTFWNAMLNNNAVVALQLEADCLRAENDKLRAALKPFADAADDFIAEKHDAHRAIVTLGDLRAAAAALKETGDD